MRRKLLGSRITNFLLITTGDFRWDYKLIKESKKLIILKAESLIQLEEIRKQEININNLINEYFPKIENELNLYKKSRSLLKDFFRLKMNSDQENHFKNLNKLSNDLLYKLGMN